MRLRRIAAPKAKFMKLMSRRGVLYVRVSDVRHVDGYSQDVQAREGDRYAERSEVEIAGRWIVSESAKEAGRKAFNEMLKFVKADPSIKVIIFEKTDRPATREVVQDKVQGPIAKRAFEMAGTGRHTLETLLGIARKAGLKNPYKKTLIGKSGLYHVLTNPFYYGLVIWKGETFQGKHEPLISEALFDGVQQILGRKKRPTRRKFPFQGMGVCGHCGRAITAEYHAKRQKNGKRHEYVHYHCTGWKNGGKVCPGSRISEREYQKEHLTALQAEATRLKTWIDKAYTERLEGLLTPEEFREKSSEWRSRQLEIQNEIRAHTVAYGKYLEEAERILELAQRAHAIYMDEPDNFTRRRLVDAVVSKVAFKDNRAVSNLWEPFETLSKVAVAAKSPDRGSLWWAREESNLHGCDPTRS